MGAGGPQRQRCLLRAARPARRLPLAAICGAPRATADAAVPHGAGAPRRRTRCGWATASPATASTTAASRRWCRRATADAAKCPARLLVGRRRPALGRARADASRSSRRSSGAARSCGAARHPGVPIRTGASFVGLGTHAAPRGVLPDLAARPGQPASRPSTGSPRSRSTTAAAGRRATGTGRVRARGRSSTTSTAGTTDWLDVPAMLRGAKRDLRIPDDRPRPGAHLGGRPRGAARRRRARDVPDRLQRRQPGHRRCTRAGRGAAGSTAWARTALRAYDDKLCGRHLGAGAAQPRRRARSAC